MRYRLPSGKETSDRLKYVRAWRRLAHPVERELGAKLTAFDPGLNLWNQETGESFLISVLVAQCIGRLAQHPACGCKILYPRRRRP